MSGLLAVPSKDHHRFHYIIRLSKPNTSLGCTSAAADSAANFNDELNGQGDRKTGSEWALERGCQRGPIIQQNQRSIIQGGTCWRTDNELSLSGGDVMTTVLLVQSQVQQLNRGRIYTLISDPSTTTSPLVVLLSVLITSRELWHDGRSYLIYIHSLMMCCYVVSNHQWVKEEHKRKLQSFRQTIVD